ncbi:MAG: sigma-70 family RNA polymerase sigma factor [Acidimicrobiia bacterium]
MGVTPGEQDPEAFVSSIREPLVRSLTLFTGDPFVAEEVAHDALVRALERWDEVSGFDRPDAWVYRVGFNRARSRFRSRAAERRALRRVDSADSVEPEDREQAIEIRRALQVLSSRQRSVLILRFYLDYSVEDTASALGLAGGTVKAHTHQALEKLRAQSSVLEETWIDE